MSAGQDAARAEWLERRRSGIGASDAACVMGLNPWKSNLDLWMEKTGRVTPVDISDKPAVQYGKEAEGFLRELFALDFLGYTVYYDEFGMFRNPEHPWLFATLDGFFETPDGRSGVLEIKTTEIKRRVQWASWKNRVPDHYYIQCLHQLLATGYDFCILKAQIKYTMNGLPNASVRHFMIDTDDEQVRADMDALLRAEIEFWRSVQDDDEPALLLPAI